jgi:aminopeptidase N
MRTVVATTHDRELLLGWLREGRAPGGEPLDQRLRWEVVRRAAETGHPGAAALGEAELARDPSSGGGLAAATARAAVPDVSAKATAWQVLSDGGTSNRTYAATARGFWSPEQHDLLAPYVRRYLEEAPGLARTRGQAFSRLVGASFPALALGADELALLDQALVGDLPTVLRRAWEDRRDDVALAVRSLDKYT